MYFVKRGYRTNVRAYWEIPGNLFNAVLGSLLTKNSVELRTAKDGVTKSARLVYSVSERRGVGFDTMWELLSCYCSTEPAIVDSVVNPFSVSGSKIGTTWRFKTTFMPCFTRFHELLYRDGVKRIPLNIADLMNAEVLAFWYHFSGLAYSNHAIFQTEGLHEEDVDLLISALRKMGIHSTKAAVKHSEGYRIMVAGAPCKRLFELISPFQ